jgi:hypothetical protein
MYVHLHRFGLLKGLNDVVSRLCIYIKKTSGFSWVCRGHPGSGSTGPTPRASFYLDPNRSQARAGQVPGPRSTHRAGPGFKIKTINMKIKGLIIQGKQNRPKLPKTWFFLKKIINTAIILKTNLIIQARTNLTESNTNEILLDLCKQFHTRLKRAITIKFQAEQNLKF